MASEMRNGFKVGTPVGGEADVLRPPGALKPGLFETACTHCGDCAAQCPQAIILADDNGFPRVDFSDRGCDFCNVCAEACDARAILPAQGFDLRAAVSDSCLSVQGIMCRTCEDHCDSAAIRFRLMRGGRAQPMIDPESCTGCGACIAPCPADALSLNTPTPPAGAEERLPASHSKASEFPDEELQYLRMPCACDT